MKYLALPVMLLLAVLAVWWVRPPRVETSLLALVGQANQAVPAAVAARGAGEIQAVVSSRDAAAAKAQAEAFAFALRQNPLLAQVRLRVASGQAEGNGVSEGDDFDALLAFYRAHSGGLLSAADVGRLAAGQGEAVLAEAQAALWSPIPRLVPLEADPYGFLEHFLRALPVGYGAWKSTPEGYLAAPLGERTAILLTVSLVEEVAADPECLVAVVETLQRMKERFVSPEVEIALSGIPMHTAAVTGQCRWEIFWLSVLSLAMIAVVGAWAFREPKLPLMMGVLALAVWLTGGLVLVGLAWAWAKGRLRSLRKPCLMLLVVAVAALAGTLALLLVFPTIHVLACVFATTVLGLTVDYAFHGLLSTAQPAQTRRSLVASWATSELAILPLACSGIPLLAQTACFIGVGLCAALGTVCWLLLPRAAAVCSGGRGAWAAEPLSKGRWAVLAVLALAVGVPLLWVRFGTDPAQLHKPAAELAQAEETFRKLSQTDGPDAGLLVLSAPTLETLLEKAEALPLGPEVPVLSRFLPSLARRRVAARAAEGFYADAQATMAELFEDPSCLQAPAEPEAWEVEALPAMLSRNFLILEPGALYTFVACAELPKAPLPEGVVAYAPRRALGAFLHGCQRRTLLLLGSVAVLLGLVLGVCFRRRALRLLLPSLFGTLAVFSFLTLRAEPVNLFHLLACFMLIGMSLDYSIFLASAPAEARRPVACSFLTSLAGFGALSFVSFRLVSSMGETFAIGLTVSYLSARLLFPVPAAETARRTEFGASGFGLELLWVAYRLFGAGVLRFLAVCVGGCLWVASPAIRSHALRFRRLANFIAAMVDKFVVMAHGRGQPTIESDGSPDTQAFLEAVAARKGVFVVSSHLGAVEVLPAYGEASVAMHAFMRVEQTAVFNRFYLRHFRRPNVHIHPVTNFGVGEAMAAGDALDAGDCVLMAGDAPFGRRLERPFLGGMRAFPVGTFRLAHALGHPIYFVACVRVASTTYRLFARPLTGETPTQCTEQFISHLEPLVRAYPDQWYQWSAPDEARKEPAFHG